VGANFYNHPYQARAPKRHLNKLPYLWGAAQHFRIPQVIKALGQGPINNYLNHNWWGHFLLKSFFLPVDKSVDIIQ
jgi:hypothetical protein